jgi:hypothetical protein
MPRTIGAADRLTAPWSCPDPGANGTGRNRRRHPGQRRPRRLPASRRLLHPRVAGFTDTDFIPSTRDSGELAALTARRNAIAMPPEAVAETTAFVIAQPQSVGIGEMLVRPTV